MDFIFRILESVIHKQLSYYPMSSKFLRLVLVIKILLTCASADIDILYRKEDVCEEKEFYSPYVRLLRTRQPPAYIIAKLYSPGYISLAKYTGVLCINGPAIVYTDVMKDPKCGTDWILSYGEPQLFTHDCMSINRLGRDAYKKSVTNEVTKESKVFGNKVFGVYLLGRSPDYRLPSFAFYPGPNFGYTADNWCIHNGASVAFVVNDDKSSAHCYSVKKYKMEGIVHTSYQGKPAFCYRDDKDEEFDSPWRKEDVKPLTNEDIIWDEENAICGSPSTPLEEGDVELEPVQLPDFRMIHPKFWSSQGSQGILYKAKKRIGGDQEETSVYSRPNPPGSLFRGEPGWSDPSSGARVSSVLREEGIETGTSEPSQKLQAEIPMTDCEEVPTLPETCSNQDIEEPCVFINHVLTLEETDWKSDSMKDGSWRLPIFNLVNSIYEKACPQVAKYFPSAISRVFQVFLSRALERNATFKEKFNQPQRNEWSEMIMDLERCNDKARMMGFYKKKNEDAMKYRTQIETKLNELYERLYARRGREADLSAAEENSGNSDPLETLLKASSLTDNSDNYTEILQEIEKIQYHLNEIPLKFPYQIFVGTEGPGASDFSKAQQVYQYREAAEIDHELDWGLDSYWKVIATVLGYCNVHYKSRDSSTYMRLYDSFTQDFLEYITEDWIKGENRPIYDQLFGEFINGPGTLWIDACQNGAYQWSKTVDLRPLRPLTLNDGDVPPRPLNVDGAAPPAPTNYFLDNPAFSKLLPSDHFDYPDDSKLSKQGGSIPEPFFSGRRDGGFKTAIVDSIVDPMHHFI